MGLTPEEQAQFETLGYVVKDDIYEYDDLQLLREGLTGAIQERCDELIADGKLDRDFAEESFETRLAKLNEYNSEAADEVLKAIWSGRFHGPGILSALRHRPLIDCIEDLIGPDIVATSIYRVRPKIPAYVRGEVPWHQDAGYSMAHCNDHLMITCWIPMVDATLDNGCLWVLPKSHDHGIIRHYTGGHGGFLEIAPEDLPPPEAVPLEMKAGSVLFMTAMTPHASFENKTDSVRWSIDLRYQDKSVPHNMDEIPEDYTPERDPVTMACFPGEAYFVIQDNEHPEHEMKDPEDFRELRLQWESATISKPGRGWTSLNERHASAEEK
ncbi:MAG: phytanoyl-CoA dioxygenase family protein [Candidatus Latescibacteria bacterium]|nr:phytanoyl-CoA dioxygenase family protein [Candidatus Latescibacterota bacterium]